MCKVSKLYQELPNYSITKYSTCSTMYTMIVIIRQVFSGRAVPGDGLRGRSGGGVELHHGQDPQGPALPGARGVHEHGGGRAVAGLRARQRHAGGRLQRRQGQGVEGVHRPGAAQARPRALQGRHVPAVHARQHADPLRLLRPDDQVPTSFPTLVYDTTIRTRSLNTVVCRTAGSTG